jgi:hypothetical protein
MTLCSLGWIASHLPLTPFDRLMGWLLGVSLTMEVALITLQQWRGVPSHFNRATPLDASIDILMLVLISLATLGIVHFCVRSFSRDLALSLDQRIAIRAGVVLLLISCLIGFAISFHGYRQISAGEIPGRVGERGVAKFPHGAAIHAMQALPLLAYLSKSAGVREFQRVIGVVLGSLSWTMLLVFAAFQTVCGRARFEWSSVGLALITTCVLAATIPSVMLVAAVGRKIFDRSRRYGERVAQPRTSTHSH